MMAVSNFAAETVEHTFASTGRTLVVREHLSFMAMVRRVERDGDDVLAEVIAAFAAGQTSSNAVAALRLQDAIIKEIVVTPRVLIRDDDEPGDDDRYGSEWMWLNDLRDDELSELIELATQGVGDSTRFPGDAAVDGGGADGEVLGDEPEPAPRPKKRKR